jgi:hypothetical protein
MDNKKKDINDSELMIIGHNSTSYKCPLIVEYIKEWEGKMLIDVKQINGRYLVFDPESFESAYNQYKQKQQ